MGDYAEMFIQGLVDQHTGEIIDGEAPGYPRSKQPPKPPKVKCPVCGKKVSSIGLAQHTKDKHPQ